MLLSFRELEKRELFKYGSRSHVCMSMVSRELYEKTHSSISKTLELSSKVIEMIDDRHLSNELLLDESPPRIISTLEGTTKCCKFEGVLMMTFLDDESYSTPFVVSSYCNKNKNTV